MGQVTVAAELDKDHPFHGLTAQRLRFCNALFSGMSHVEAYRQSYDCEGMSERTIYDRAAGVWREPLVRAKLTQMRVDSERESTLFRNLSREFVLNGMMNIALNGDKDSVRLAAYTQLGKTVGIDLFREVTLVTKQQRTPEDVDRDLKTKLDELRQTLEGTARDVTAPAGGRQAAVPHARGDRRRKPSP